MSALVLRTYAAVVRRLGDARRGATAVEYALLVALIAGVLIAAITALGQGTEGLYATMNALAKYLS
ncbi:MAG TPA: Flp family type IVb pilin [Propionibacteriaceae bacterium]|nr:Flp family type IVb pilin [Propionibacteriaceae bacterium]